MDDDQEDIKPPTYEAMADAILEAVPLKLFEVTWHGTDDELVQLLTAVKSSCDSVAALNKNTSERSCGDHTGSCLMCAALHDQKVVDHLLYFKRTVQNYGEWAEGRGAVAPPQPEGE